MGFFDIEEQAKSPELKGHSLAFLHKHQCAVCPLNHQTDLMHPHMEPTGSKRPLVYILGEAPGKNEDKKGVQFIGRSGRLIRDLIPDDWLRDIRWNNCVRTRPPDNRTPTTLEIECCRPSVEGDIERTKPAAIFGFGAVPLAWATGESGITKWAGRRLPIKVGSHSCWFYPMVHPSYVMREVNKTDKDKRDWDLAFKLHLRRAFKEVDKGLPPAKVYSAEDATSNIHLAMTVDDVLKGIKRMHGEKVVGFDYETSRLRPYEKGAKILTIGMAGEDYAFAFPVRHRQAKWTDRELATIEAAVEGFLLDAPCKKVSHRLAFEGEWSAVSFGRDTLIHGRWEDTESQAFILDERPDCHSLDFLCLQYFGLRIKALSKVDLKALDNFSLPVVLRYNGMDAKFHRLLHLAQMPRIRDEGLLEYYRHHVPRVIASVLTQVKGVPLDQAQVEKFAKKYERSLEDIEDEIADLDLVREYKRRFGETFEPSNNNHVKKALTKLAKLDLEKVDEKVLSKVKHPLARLVLRWRKDAKLLSTYIKPVQPGSKHVYPDGLLHPIINTTRTRTSRTSSEDPNIQNWPKRGPNKIIRKQIRSVRDDVVVVAFDFAGIQARNVAMESKDKGLVKHYWAHYDIHTDWLERLNRIVPGWASKEEMRDKEQHKEVRNTVKNKFVFPSFFGAQPKSIASDLKIEEGDAEELQAEFFDEFPDVKGWHERLIKFYYRNGYVTGLSQFKRRAPVERNQMINSPIQADEAIIVCNAWGRLAALENPVYTPNLMVHDDLTFFWKRKNVERYSEVVIGEMLAIEYDWINVPLGVEMSIGDNWADLKAEGEFESAPGKKGWWEIKK
jgi:uracil-DNA glycosylase family 4